MYFFATAAASYLSADVKDFRAIMSEMSPLPTSQRCFCATALNSHHSPCLDTNCARPDINFQPNCRANLNFVNKTKLEFQFVQFVTKQGAVTVQSCRAKTSLGDRERRHFAHDGAKICDVCAEVTGRSCCEKIHRANLRKRS